VGAQLHRYIEDKLYWVLHAPRQTGKTTFLKSWMRKNQTFESVKVEGIKHILQYRERIDPAAPAYLVIFDRRAAIGGVDKPGWGSGSLGNPMPVKPGCKLR
jgi:hypothetical protein